MHINRVILDPEDTSDMESLLGQIFFLHHFLIFNYAKFHYTVSDLYRKSIYSFLSLRMLLANVNLAFTFLCLAFVSIRKHGRLLEEGASGFLAGKLPISGDKPSDDGEASWNSFNQLIKSKCSDNGFGSSNWASVYLASTPQQAASLGLTFPGVDEV